MKPDYTSTHLGLGLRALSPDTLAASPLPTLACASTLLGLAWTVRDYRAWISFGTGGTPANIWGYWRITKLRVKLLLSGRDLRDAGPLEGMAKGPAFLHEVPRRKGGRPAVLSRPLPQRQKPEPISPETKARLLTLMHTLHTSRPDILELKKSHTEGGSADALYARPSLPTLSPDAHTLQLEIAHAHPQDCSLHLLLAPADAARVVRAQWGERFVLDVVPDGWIMVYAPRDEEEMDVVERIVRAAVAYVTGVAV